MKSDHLRRIKLKFLLSLTLSVKEFVDYKNNSLKIYQMMTCALFD